MPRILRPLLTLIFLLIATAVGRAQGQQLTAGPFPVSGLLYVCPVPSGGTPCPSPVSIFSNSTLTTGISNPIVVFAQQVYTFYVAGGQYTLEMPAAGYQAVVGGSSSGGVGPTNLPQLFSQSSQFPGLITFGDSLTNPCNGVQNAALSCYVNLINADVGGQLTNLAQTGTGIADLIKLKMYPNVNPSYTHNPPVILFIGVNDANPGNANSYSTANQQSNWSTMMQGAIAWLTIPRNNKVFGQDTACVQAGGGWSADNALVTGLAVQSTTNGNTLTCTITTTGPNLYVAYRIIDGKAGTASWTVDSVAQTALSFTGIGGGLISTAVGTTDSVALATVPIAAGTHTVVFTVTSSTNANNIVSIAWLGSALPTPVTTASITAAIAPPTVFVGGIIHQQNSANDAITGTFNTLCLNAVNTMAGQGLPVSFIDIRSRVSPTTGMFDALHPNEAGNLAMRDAWDLALRSSGVIFDSVPSTTLDRGNRANSTSLGSNWTTLTGFQSPQIISNNFAGTGNSANFQGTMWGTTQFYGDQSAQITMQSSSDGAQIAGIGVRATGSTGYLCYTNGGAGGAHIGNITNSTTVANLGAAATVTYAANDTLQCTAQGTQIQFLKNGVAQITTTDSTYAFGQPWIFINGTSTTSPLFNNFVAQNIQPNAKIAAVNNFSKQQNFFAGDQTKVVESTLGLPCTNGELALSAGWQSTGSATVTGVSGNGQTCIWTITTGTTTAANPTVTDTLTNPLQNAGTVCWMNITGGTHTAVAGEYLRQTSLSTTAPVFTANFTPTAGGLTYIVIRGCGP